MPGHVGETQQRITLPDMALSVLSGWDEAYIFHNFCYSYRFLVEEGISVMKKGGKCLDPEDLKKEEFSECELSLLSKVEEIINSQLFLIFS